MKLIGAFIKMIRFPNLLFIALTQLLFHFCIIVPVFTKAGSPLIFNELLLALLILSSVLIAAAGYIINDYFDINIDLVNKPKKNVVDIVVSRRWAMLWHSLLSFIGVAIGFYLGWKTGIFWIGFMHLLCSISLFAYSASFKRKLLIGNVLTSLLTAWSVAVLGLATFYAVRGNTDIFSGINNTKIFKFTILYSSFAFIISLIREAIKDIEDMEGDEKYGCTTMPIVWGITGTKIYIAVLLGILIAALVILQIYVLQFNWHWAVAYSAVMVIFPLGYIFYQLFKAKSVKNFHDLSSYTKLVILTGIFSMIFFYFYL
jgi:4-hydroxybenzoate polyprenyltransferase